MAAALGWLLASFLQPRAAGMAPLVAPRSRLTDAQGMRLPVSIVYFFIFIMNFGFWCLVRIWFYRIFPVRYVALSFDRRGFHRETSVQKEKRGRKINLPFVGGFDP